MAATAASLIANPRISIRISPSWLCAYGQSHAIHRSAAYTRLGTLPLNTAWSLQPSIQPKPRGVDARWVRVTVDSNSFPKPLRVPAGQRIYAFGGLEGDLELLRRVLLQIYFDTRILAEAETTLILLGDILGRSAPPWLLMSLARLNNPRFNVLMGSSEASLAASLRHHKDVRSQDRRGTPVAHNDDQPHSVAFDQTIGQPDIPADALSWIDSLPMSWSAGDYVFSTIGVSAKIGDARQPLLNVVDGMSLGSQLGIDDASFLSGPVANGIPTRKMEHAASGGSPTGRRTASVLALEGDERRVIKVLGEPSDLTMGDVEPGSGPQTYPTLLDDKLIVKEIVRLISAIAVAPILNDQDRRSVTSAPGLHINGPLVADAIGVIADPRTGWRSLPVLSMFVLLAAISLVRPSGSESTNPRPLPHLDARSASGIDRARLHTSVNRLPLGRTESDAASVKTRPKPENARQHVKAKRAKLAHRHRFANHVGRTSHLVQTSEPSSASAKAAHLTGEALTKALAEDHLATQKLNNAELSSIQHRRVRRSLFKRRIKL